MQKKIRLLRSWNTLPRAQNLKPKFEFQTLLARNSLPGTSELFTFGANSHLCCNYPAGTSELLPFGVNLDLPWDWRLPEIPYRGFLFGFPCWGLLCFPFVGTYIFPCLGFTMLLLYWGTTYKWGGAGTHWAPVNSVHQEGGHGIASDQHHQVQNATQPNVIKKEDVWERLTRRTYRNPE